MTEDKVFEFRLAPWVKGVFYSISAIVLLCGFVVFYLSLFSSFPMPRRIVIFGGSIGLIYASVINLRHVMKARLSISIDGVEYRTPGLCIRVPWMNAKAIKFTLVPIGRSLVLLDPIIEGNGYLAWISRLIYRNRISICLFHWRSDTTALVDLLRLHASQLFRE